MKLRKLLACVLVVMMMVTALAACGSKDDSKEGKGSDSTTENSGKDDDSNDSTDYSGKKLTVGIWGGNDAEEAAINKVKDDFEALTGASVEFKVYTDYNTQLQADFIGQTAPDVFYVDGAMFAFYSSLEVMEVLDPAEMGTDAYYENLLGAFTTDGGDILCIPKDVSTLATYYNTDMLEAVGMTGDDIPEALEEYPAFLTDLQAKLDEEYGAGQVTAMSYNHDLSRMLHLLERDGASIANDDDSANLSDAAVLDNFKIIMELVDTGAYKTPSEVGLGWNGEAFGAEKIAIMEEGNWVYKTLVDDFSDVNFGVKDMPSYNGEKSSMSFTVGYGVYAGSDEKELAKEWIRYATGVEGMTTWCSGAGCLPSRDDVAENMDVRSDDVWATHLDQQAYAKPWQAGINIDTINSNFQNFFPGATKGETTIAEAMEKADSQANSEIGNAQ